MCVLCISVHVLRVYACALCLRVCLHVCVYLCGHMCMCVYIQYVHVCVHMRMCVCMCVCTQIEIQPCAQKSRPTAYAVNVQSNSLKVWFYWRIIVWL